MERPPETPRPEQEGFGEATLGEGQASNPPADPEMIRDESEGTSEDEAPNTGEGVVPEDDQDAEPTKTAEQIEEDEEGRDQAEG
jgi:hypothetical protein